MEVIVLFDQKRIVQTYFDINFALFFFFFFFALQSMLYTEKFAGNLQFKSKTLFTVSFIKSRIFFGPVHRGIAKLHGETKTRFH